jgi:hypothetical protein
MDNLEDIVRGLTKGERGFVTMPLLSGFGVSYGWFHDNDYQIARQIYRKGLATKRKVGTGTSAAIPTPLGLEVRARLLSSCGEG